MARSTAVLLAAAVLLAGCSYEGLARYAEGDFAACLEASGVDLAGVEDWPVAKERDVLATPDALDCVIDELPVADQPRVMERGFPEESEADQFPAEFGEATEANTLVVVDYVEARWPDVDAERVAAVLNALGWDDYDREFGPRDVVAASMVRPEGPRTYRRWLARYERTDDYQSRADFVQEQTRRGSTLGEQIEELSEQLYERQQATRV